VDEMVTGDDLVDGYDANSDGEIDRAEVGQAVRDFIGRQIEHDDVVQVIAQYFKDLQSGS
jgi:Ca2+-binding EF-hand superfamily protein